MKKKQFFSCLTFAFATSKVLICPNFGGFKLRHFLLIGQASLASSAIDHIRILGIGLELIVACNGG